MMANGSAHPIQVYLEYPRADGRPKSVHVHLVDVRAADALKIEFDFDRDGWSIRMDRTRDVGYSAELVRENEEVAFVPAWNEGE